MDGFQNALFFGLVSGSLYAIVALGYSLIYSVLRFVNFAHGDLLAVGAYFCWILGRDVLGLPVIPSIVISVLMTGGISYLIGVTVLIPARKRSAMTALVVAIGISIIIQNLISLTCTSDARSFYSNLNLGQFFGLFTIVHILTLLVSMASLALLWWWFLKRTDTGIEVRACASNPKAAYHWGLRRDRTFGIVFFISGIFAGLAGIAIGLDNQIITPTMGFSFGIRAFIASVIGGITNLWGAVAGAFILGITENLVVYILLATPSLSWLGSYVSKDATALILLIIVMLWKPKGLFSQNLEARP